MESSDQWAGPDLPDWELLSALFADGGAYRHRMGLRRAEAREFYAATAAGNEIRQEKQSILERDGERRMVITPEGHLAASEFACVLGLASTADETGDEKCWRRFNLDLSHALEPDLLIVQPPEWSLVWANVCFPSRWSLEGKAQRPLAWIHDAVPGLNNELGTKITTFFSRLAPGDGWRRANWGMSASAARDQHPLEPIPRLTSEAGAERVFLRVEDQHLLKLPQTEAIAFGIRITSFAWSDIRHNSIIAASILEKLRSMSTQVATYKGLTDILRMMEKR